ncbi:MAG: NAD(P)H-dependent oxidoreductase [Crocinitomicaceae bacterium]|nr:NAD(P)H-dependent oxidoreductase [Crocinitomicaceae bacterium]
MNSIIEDLNWRYAVKQFDSTKKVSDSDFEVVKESLRLTPTSYGLQSFTALIIESNDLREKLIEASYGQRQVADASHLIVLCSYSTIKNEDVDSYMQLISNTRNVAMEHLEGFSNTIKGTVNSRTEEEILNWSTRQTYIALGQLLHTCASLRIDTTPMEGFDPAKYDEIIGLSERNLTATLVCPVGYRHEEDSAQHGAKVRKPLDDLIQTI